MRNDPGSCFRQLATDTTPYEQMQDATSRVLFAATVTHPQTHLDWPLTQEIEDVIIPQFEMDMVSVNALHGPEGGLVGRDTTTFWWLSANEDLHITPKEFLMFISTLSQILIGEHNNKKVFWPAINTPYTATKQDARNLAISGASYQTKGHPEEVKRYHSRPTSYDVDARIMERIMEYRNVDKDDKDILIATHKQTNDPAKSQRASPESNEFPTLQHTTGLFDAHLYLDVFQGRDANGKHAFIKLHCFRITPKVPGVDPCVAIQQWWTRHKSEHKIEQKRNFQEVLNHMSNCINQV